MAECRAQQDTAYDAPSPLKISGFADFFYAYDFNKPGHDYRQTFLYNHNRHNQFNLNLGLIKASLLHKKFRANAALHKGTYVNDNYAGESDFWKNVSEANAGMIIHRKKNLWIDVGIFSSHIGFESAISIDHWTLTRSLLAENSPYFQTGAKLTYSPNIKWEIVSMVCNGWQRVQKIPGNSIPSFCTQIKYTRSEKCVLNSSAFIGTDDPDSTRRMRYFHNFYAILKPTEHIGVTAGFDIGIQQKEKSSSLYNCWMSPVLIIRYALTKTWATSFRAEYYEDPSGVIISQSPTKGFKTTGFSLNLDCAIHEHLLWRIEGRLLNTTYSDFNDVHKSRRENFCITTSLAYALNR
jgi:hypothetical protein